MDRREMKVTRVGHGSDQRGQGPIWGHNSRGANEDGSEPPDCSGSEEGGGQLRDRRPPIDQRCMQWDVVGHVRKDHTNFTEMLKNNVGYTLVRPRNPLR